jgi:hypothetical protein
MTNCTLSLTRSGIKSNIDVPNMRYRFGLSGKWGDISLTMNSPNLGNRPDEVSRQIQKMWRMSKKVINPAVCRFPIRT